MGARKINFLVVGGGAREHAVVWKLSQSELLDKLFLADANDGFRHLGENLTYETFFELAQKSKDKNVGVVFVGSENYLAQGIVDVFRQFGIKCVGADSCAVMLEASKSYAKEFMFRNGILTAPYILVESADMIDGALAEFEAPFVVKADGLCGGKGVVICRDKTQARSVMLDFFNGKFGAASKKIIVEKYLAGEEFSLMSFFDGKTLKSFLPARDFKKLSSSPDAPNTGGMGAFCPVDLSPLQQVKLDDYEKKLQAALLCENSDFTGVVYSGLVWHENDFWVLEYNMRLGDPETQALLCHLNSDLGEIFYATVNGKLDTIDFSWKKGYSACVVFADKGYPFVKTVTGEVVDISWLPVDMNVFYAGVARVGENLTANGGRILSLCTNHENPFEKIYSTTSEFLTNSFYYRNDLKIN